MKKERLPFVSEYRIISIKKLKKGVIILSARHSGNMLVKHAFARIYVRHATRCDNKEAIAFLLDRIGHL
jgi:hypothetical protein